MALGTAFHLPDWGQIPGHHCRALPQGDPRGLRWPRGQISGLLLILGQEWKGGQGPLSPNMGRDEMGVLLASWHVFSMFPSPYANGLHQEFVRPAPRKRAVTAE